MREIYQNVGHKVLWGPWDVIFPDAEHLRDSTEQRDKRCGIFPEMQWNN